MKKNGKDRMVRTVVTPENLQRTAREVLEAAQRRFGRHLLSFSDQYLENTIHPWIDQYVREHYLFPGQPSKDDLDEAIAFIMNGD